MIIHIYMPLLLISFFFFLQPELEFISMLFWKESFLICLDTFFFQFSMLTPFSNEFNLTRNIVAFDLNTKLSYNYGFRTHFTQTYLHAAFNEYMKPYQNLTNFNKLFGDYNIRTLGKKRKHARATHAKELFTLLYSYTFDYYGLYNRRTNNVFVMFYFKKQHLYSVVEMAYAVIYLGMIYVLSMMHVKNVEESSLPIRESEEIDEEYAQSFWYFYRDNRRGMTPPQMDDNEEVDFAYPQHPLEWDDLGNIYRWESHFFNIMYSYIVGWGVSQSAVSMFLYDYALDLHFVDIFSTLIFLFLFWRLFFYPQFYFYFNRFNFKHFFYLDIGLHAFYKFYLMLLKSFYNYTSTFIMMIFSNFLSIDSLKVEISNLFDNFVSSFSNKYLLLLNCFRFYRYIYSSFQKDLSLFEKRNKYEILLTSNLCFLENSRDHNYDLYYFQGNKDSMFFDLTFFTDFFVRNYSYINFFYLYQNLYFINNRIYLPSIPIFPFYSDYYNTSILPIWGADLIFNHNSNALVFSEASTSWFFSNQYNKEFLTQLSDKLNLANATKYYKNNFMSI